MNKYFRAKSDHQLRVEKFLVGAHGFAIPDKPRPATDDQLLLQAVLLTEELFEFFEAAGVDVYLKLNGEDKIDIGYTDLKFEKIPGICDLEGVADALADISVVNTGTMSLNGIADVSLLEEVDLNNEDKLETGHRDPTIGKFIKSKDHVGPDITGCLIEQGWDCKSAVATE